MAIAEVRNCPEIRQSQTILEICPEEVPKHADHSNHLPLAPNAKRPVSEGLPGLESGDRPSDITPLILANDAADLRPQRDNFPTVPQQNPTVPILPETEPDSVPEAPSEPPETEPLITPQDLVLETLTSSSERYPYITNPTDNLTFSPHVFRPNQDETFGEVDLRFADESPILNQFTFAHFPQHHQFYWVLDGNRVVIETQGWQGGVRYQGHSTATHVREAVTLRQTLWGTQAVWAIPRSTLNLAPDSFQNVGILAVSGAIRNPEGVPAGRVVINSGFDLNSPNTHPLTQPVPNPGTASSHSATGGVDLFQALSDREAPLILQGFPTVDLSPILDHGTVILQETARIPAEALDRAGISWGNILTGEPAQFNAEVTSTPGIKIGRRGQFDNLDLFNVLANPELDGVEQDLNYLNSLFWTSFGIRTPEFDLMDFTQEESDWYRAYVSRPHNRTLIEYDPVELRATYTNVFSNPGLSLVFTPDEGGLDELQSLHATLGLALGGIFEAIAPRHLNAHLSEARQARDAGDGFAPLVTQATPEQRRQMNQRLNRSLAYASFSSGLEQLSGQVTVSGVTTLDSSRIFRLQTGLHRQSVQLFQRELSLSEGETFVSDLQFSSDEFGPLTFVGVPTGSDSSSPVPINEAFATQVVLFSPDGQQFIQQASSNDTAVSPLMINASDMAFDRIELTRVDQLETEFRSFEGYLSLPAVEVTFAGTAGDLNYSLSSGLWFNLDADAAPGVTNNNLGETEPTVGVYANAILNLLTTRSGGDGTSPPTYVDTYGPLLRLNWDSTDDFFAALNYSYSHQTRTWGWSITPGIAFVTDPDDQAWIAFLNGELRTGSGLEVQAGVEVNDETYYNLQLLQRITPRLSAGVYLQNFSFDSEGLEERSLNFNYGVLMQYRMNGSNTFLETRIGTGDRGIDSRLEGGFRF